jgi:putative cardiolipin synthase
MHRKFTLLVFLLVAALAQGCTLSRAQIRQANAVVAAATDRQLDCAQDDHCATPSPLLDAAQQAIADSTSTSPVHVVTLLDEGDDAMAARISLVRAAKQTIDVQTYIWEEDDTGWLMLDELIHAAQRGVRVRILADQLFSFRDPELLAVLASVHANLTVRLYNPTFQSAKTPPLEFAAGILCCFYKFNQRMHNKLMVIDDAIGIAGGRNYENRYFEWDDSFSYRDRDIMVGGPVARAMTASFEQFWKHPRSTPLTHLRDVNHQIVADGDKSRRWPEPTYTRPDRVAEVLADAQDREWLQERLIDPTIKVGAVDYLSDLPAKTDEPAEKEARDLTRRIMGLVTHAKTEVVLQTPYLLLSTRARKIFRSLHKRSDPPRVIVSTNSLASTDAFAVYGVSYKYRKRYLTQLGFEIYELKPQANDLDFDDLGNGDAPTANVDDKPAKRKRHGFFGSRGARNRPAPLLSTGTRIGLHAKSMVIDDNLAMVGSHNFDPRSDHYNTESGVLVYDHRVAAALRASIMHDTEPGNAWVVAPRQPTVPFLFDISQAIGNVSERLPFFDLWPTRYATSYDLKPGCKPVPASDPNFFKCYQAVGDFPEVDLSLKIIYTRLVTAFGVSASGIL